MEKYLRLLTVVFSIFALVGCPPYSETKVQTKPDNFSHVESLLSKTFSGQDSISYLNHLRSQGYSISFQLVAASEMTAMNGHSGGGFQRNGSEIIIFANNSLNEVEQAHVVAHELVHIKDDFEVDQFLQYRTDIDSAAQDFVNNYQSRGTNTYDPRLVDYVLGTLFCSEVRAYTKNQNLSDQGLQTSFFAKGNQLPQFVDQNYIRQFNTSYGSSATAMKNWCLSFSSMTNIQNGLAW